MQANIWWKGKSCLHAPKAGNVKGQGKIPQLKTETTLNWQSTSRDPPAPLCVKLCPESALGVPEALSRLYQPVLRSAHSLACTGSPVTEPQNQGILRGWNGPQSSFCCIPLPWAWTPSSEQVPQGLTSLALNTCRDGASTAHSVPQHRTAGCQHSHRAAWKKFAQVLTVQKTKKVCDYLQQST